MYGLGNPQTASPPSSFSSCHAGICSIFQDKERSPNPSAPPNPLLWMWFKSTQSVSVHCFRGQLENLRNEWKQTVRDQLNCILSSCQKRTRGTFLKQGWHELYCRFGGGRKKEKRDEERFIQRTRRGVCSGSESRLTPRYLIRHIGTSSIRLPRATPQLPFRASQTEHLSPSSLLHFHCATDFSRISLGNGPVGLMLRQLVPALFRTTATSKRDRPCPLVSLNSHK